MKPIDLSPTPLTRAHYDLVTNIGCLVLDHSWPDDYGNSYTHSLDPSKVDKGWNLCIPQFDRRSHFLTT